MKKKNYKNRQNQMNSKLIITMQILNLHQNLKKLSKLAKIKQILLLVNLTKNGSNRLDGVKNKK